MSYDLKGKVKLIEPTKQVTDSFSKREFVISDTSGQYEQTIKLQMTQDNCVKLDNVNVGDEVNVSFFLNGREWTNPKDGKVSYFNSLDAWKVEKVTNTGTEQVDDLPDFLQD